jgi:uncharacterized membrane protein YdjX (TVP38/TMEM64 family)
MRRWVASVFALVVLLGVLFGLVALTAIGRMVSGNSAPPEWQAFVLAGVLGILAVVFVGGTAVEVLRSRRR